MKFLNVLSPTVSSRRARLWLARMFVLGVVLVVGPWATMRGVMDYQFSKRLSVGGYGFATSLVSLSPSELDQRLTNMKATGVQWVRFDLSWDKVQHDSANTYDWSAYDRLTKTVTARGFKVLMIVDFAPPWAVASGCDAPALCRPADAAAYGRFAGAAARHYRPYGVEDWEIWNEPNISFRFAPAADPALYVQMLKASYVAIKRADPTAVVIAGGTSPAATDGSNYTPLDFVKALYAQGAKGSFDAVAAHPYTAPISPAQSHPTDAWGQLAAMHNVMVAHGDGSKRIWITEFGAATDGADGAKNRVSEDMQAQMATESVSLLRKLPWVGPMFWYDYIDAGTATDTTENFYGLVRADGSHKAAYDAFVRAVAGSSIH
jgi:hypothetical protein